MKSNFIILRLREELDKQTTGELRETFNQGLNELISLVSNKPDGWELELYSIEATFKVLRDEIQKRERGEP